jgi:hypothetical protein
LGRKKRANNEQTCPEIRDSSSGRLNPIQQKKKSRAHYGGAKHARYRSVHQQAEHVLP